MSSLNSQMIVYPSNHHTTPAYLAQPASPGRYPVLIAIQEWWGLVPHIRDVADRFAAEGFVVLAPDLYHGEVAREPDEARKLAMALDRQRAVAEIDAAARYLATQPNVHPQTVGVVGWCMGGALALSTAAESEAIGAVVAFYGRPLAAEDVARIQAPVLGLYGEEDKGIPVSSVHAFERELAAAGVTHDIHVYPGAGHAFFNDTRADSYQPDAAGDAWQRTLDWFHRHLI